MLQKNRKCYVSTSHYYYSPDRVDHYRPAMLRSSPNASRVKVEYLDTDRVYDLRRDIVYVNAVIDPHTYKVLRLTGKAKPYEAPGDLPF